MVSDADFVVLIGLIFARWSIDGRAVILYSLEVGPFAKSIPVIVSCLLHSLLKDYRI